MQTINKSELAKAKKLLKLSSIPRAKKVKALDFFKNDDVDLDMAIGDKPSTSSVSLQDGRRIANVVSALLSFDPESDLTFLTIKVINPKILVKS